jgi:hypothetical protein
VIAFLAPAEIAPVADQYGLAVGMMLAAAALLVAGGLWLGLPETVRRAPARS